MHALKTKTNIVNIADENFTDYAYSVGITILN